MLKLFARINFVTATAGTEIRCRIQEGKFSTGRGLERRNPTGCWKTLFRKVGKGTTSVVPLSPLGSVAL